jgi:hypothetical protein
MDPHRIIRRIATWLAIASLLTATFVASAIALYGPDFDLDHLRVVAIVSLVCTWAANILLLCAWLVRRNRTNPGTQAFTRVNT